MLTFADFVAANEADIEDLFQSDLYLTLVNEEFAASLQSPIRPSDLASGHPRIMYRLEQRFKAKPLKGTATFNHFRPARYFAEHAGKLTPRLDEATLDRFEAVFKQVNSLL